MLRTGGLAAAAIAILACGGGVPEAQEAVRTDSAGIEIVSNAVEDRPLDWTFEPVASLGGADSGPESFFRVLPHGLGFDGRGRIHILDSGNRRVRLFTPSGEHIRSVGREGEGPGEFQFPVAFTVDSSGAVTVHDVLHRALLEFDPSGEFTDQRPAPPGLFGRMRAGREARVFAIRARDTTLDAMVYRLNRAVRRDTVELAGIRLTEARSFRYESCGIGISLAPLFADPIAWDARAGRVALVDGPEYRVRIFDERGAEVRWLRRPLEPEAATVEHAARELGEGEEWTIGGGESCVVPPEEVVEKRGVAERFPTIENVAVAPDGSVWVRREVPGEEGGPVDVFDATGEYVGTLPEATPWPAAFGAGDRVLVLETDALDVQHVVVYRIRRG